MSYRLLDHATDAIIELQADTLQEAFKIAGIAVIQTTLDIDLVQPLHHKEFTAQGKDLRYLLYSWLEEVIYVLITQGFAIKKLNPIISKDDGYKIVCKISGEPIDLSKHRFKIEIKAPTFYDMQIKQNGGVYMRFLLDL